MLLSVVVSKIIPAPPLVLLQWPLVLSLAFTMQPNTPSVPVPHSIISQLLLSIRIFHLLVALASWVLSLWASTSSMLVELQHLTSHLSRRFCTLPRLVVLLLPSIPTQDLLIPAPLIGYLWVPNLPTYPLVLHQSIALKLPAVIPSILVQQQVFRVFSTPLNTGFTVDSLTRLPTLQTMMTYVITLMSNGSNSQGKISFSLWFSMMHGWVDGRKDGKRQMLQNKCIYRICFWSDKLLTAKGHTKCNTLVGHALICTYILFLHIVPEYFLLAELSFHNSNKLIIHLMIFVKSFLYFFPWKIEWLQ